MERLIAWPYIAAEWAVYKIRGWCWPYCRTEGLVRIQNPSHELFPIRVRCKVCGRKREI
jgi:hypothetical protein